MADPNANSLETPQDLGKTPAAIAKRWKLELKLADKREAKWRQKGKTIYDLYTPDAPTANSFNILWTNTETLRQAVYNSLPQPQAKRRYSNEDELGKNVSNVLTRALEFAQDTYDFDAVLKADMLSMLLPGRAVSRVRYIPQISSAPGNKPGTDDYDEETEETEAYEEIEWEQVICENVQWDDFRILCAAKTWDSVSAIGFKHTFTRQDCIDKFGEEIGKAISLDSPADEDVKKSKDCEDLFKTASIWEIWDKDEKEVIWICESYPNPCKVQDDPLELCGFFPVPRPIYAIENNQSLVPASLYTQYEQQAKELNKVSGRINKLIDALKVRGIYDSTLSELGDLMKAADNEFVPAMNAAAYQDRGGLEKAIWMMPIEQAALVLKELYAQREATKQVIYEITGISDIMRSASDPNETFGAQKIKTQWGTQRLQRMQKEVQRYIRDLIRLKAEIISEKFQPETLEAMTLVQLPHQAMLDQQKAQIMAQYQQQAMAAQQSGQPAPPPPQLPPMPISWEAVVQAMRSDATRTYHIDIETDSTLSASQDSDAAGMKELLTGLSQIMSGFGPAVQQGAMSVDVLKELMLAVVRRARMGSAVEDAIDKIKQPPPPADPNAGKVQAQQQIEQAKLQASAAQNQQEMQFEQMKAQLDAQVEQHKQEVQQQQIEQQNQLEAQRAQMEQHNNAILEQMRIAADAQAEDTRQQFALLIAQMNNAAKVEVAEIAAGTALQTAQITAAQAGSGE
jgi:hypothetical protein